MDKMIKIPLKRETIHFNWTGKHGRSKLDFCSSDLNRIASKMNQKLNKSRSCELRVYPRRQVYDERADEALKCIQYAGSDTKHQRQLVAHQVQWVAADKVHRHYTNWRGQPLAYPLNQE